MANGLSRNGAIAGTHSCDAPSQKVGATPSSRDKPATPFGLADGSGDEGVAATHIAASPFN